MIAEVKQGIAVPAKSRAMLERLIADRDKLNAMIDAALVGVRTALDVPDDWQIAALDVGFVPPVEVPPAGEVHDISEVSMTQEA